jgi:hypothetical protein
VKKYAPPKDVNSVQYLMELKDEFYNAVKSYSSKGIYEEQFVICGLINIIKFELEEQSRYMEGMLFLCLQITRPKK